MQWEWEAFKWDMVQFRDRMGVAEGNELKILISQSDMAFADQGFVSIASVRFCLDNPNDWWSSRRCISLDDIGMERDADAPTSSIDCTSGESLMYSLCGWESHCSDRTSKEGRSAEKKYYCIWINGNQCPLVSSTHASHHLQQQQRSDIVVYIYYL